MSFYRKYRPQVIDELDNPDVRQKIFSLLNKPRRELPHAYLLSGPKGTGKTTTARIIAKIFNCENPDKKTGPCGKCDQCLTIARGTNLDIVEIDGASNRGIDEIRLLRERIGLAPVKSDFTIYIIDEVHMLTNEAFNALLKTLEEPPAHAVFVLATTDPQKIPQTVKSRCVQLTFSKAGKPELVKSIDRIVKNEKLKIDPDAKDLIAGYSDGSFRDAAKLIEQASLESEQISSDMVRKLLAISDTDQVDAFILGLQQGDLKSTISLIETLVASGSDIRFFLEQVLAKLESQLVEAVKNGSDMSEIVIKKRLITHLTRAYAEIRISPIPELPVEAAVIDIVSVDKTPEVKKSDWKLSERSKTATKPPVSPPVKPAKAATPEATSDNDKTQSLGLLTLEKLSECWKDVIEEVKPYNHSIAGVLRSARPKNVSDGVVTIEAFYKFHLEKLSESKVRDILAATMKKLFGEKARVEIVLGKK